jgi:hypothetical protein
MAIYKARTINRHIVSSIMRETPTQNIEPDQNTPSTDQRCEVFGESSDEGEILE